jgi:creatinine amidohydrolase
VGDPRKASKEKGEKFFKAVTEKIAVFFEEVAKAKPGEFYI